CQAEDGIRDWSVTGVQTCALPTSCCATQPRRSRASVCARGSPRPVSKDSARVAALGDIDELNSAIGVILAEQVASEVRAALEQSSEERRVGKERRRAARRDDTGRE